MSNGRNTAPMDVDEILLDRPDFLGEISSEGSGGFCQNFINSCEIVRASCRWFNSVSDMLSRLLDESEDDLSDTASDKNGDEVVNGSTDEESVTAVCNNKPEDEPTEIILDETSSGSVEVNDNTNACDDEGMDSYSLNSPDNEFLLSEAHKNEETSDCSGDQVVNGPIDEESVTAVYNEPEDESTEIILDETSSGGVEVNDNANACDDEEKELCPLDNPDNKFLPSEAHENEEIAETNSSHYLWPNKTNESASLQARSSNEADEPPKVGNLEPYVQPQKDTANLDKIDMPSSADAVGAENEFTDKFDDVDLQDTDDEDYELALASYSECKNNPCKKKFGASLIRKLQWLKAKKGVPNVQYGTGMETQDTRRFDRSSSLYTKLADDSLDLEWELL